MQHCATREYLKRCGIPHYKYGRRSKGVRMDLEEIGWAIPRSREVPQRTPLFFSLPELQLSTDSIIHHLQYLKQQKQKMSRSFSNNINSWNTTISVSNHFAASGGRPNILAWLSPLDPRIRHQDIRDRRVENIGEWILRTEEFRSWYASSTGGESDKPVLFCYGDPGVGKTFIR